MAKTKFFNLDTDNTLGGQNTSHYVIPSQRAVKEYIDNNQGREIYYDYTGHHPILIQSNNSSPYTCYYCPDFTLTEGVIFYMLFTKNNVANFQLNINSTGAKPVYMYYPASSDYNMGTVVVNYIHPGDVAVFTYADNKYYLLGVHRAGNDTNTFVCETVAATAAKSVINVPSVSLYPGMVVGVTFNYTNTASNPTLNINGMGAKSIYYNGATIVSDNLDKAGKAGMTTYYMYNGTYWVYMGESIDRVYVDSTALPTSSFDAYFVPVLGTGATAAATANQTTYSDTLNVNSGIYVVSGNSSVNAGNPYISLNKPLDLGIGGTSVTDSGDFIPIADSSEGNVLVKGPQFGSSTTTFLRNDGTWATPSGGGGGGNVPTPTAQDAGKTLVVDSQGSYALSTTLLSGYEVTTNKVTSLSAQSTDTQYPSAKCVYDLFGDIDNVLNAILNG